MEIENILNDSHLLKKKKYTGTYPFMKTQILAAL